MNITGEQTIFYKEAEAKNKATIHSATFWTARQVLEKRVGEWEKLLPEQNIFSVMSNQKYNDYLKEVAELKRN